MVTAQWTVLEHIHVGVTLSIALQIVTAQWTVLETLHVGITKSIALQVHISVLSTVAMILPVVV